MWPNNSRKIAQNQKTGFQENFAEVENIGKLRVFSFGQNFRRQAKSAKKCAKIAQTQKTVFQDNFAEVENISKIKGFSFGEHFRGLVFQQNLPKNEPKCENLPSGKFRPSQKHRQNEGFFVRAKFSETGRQAKPAEKMRQNRAKSENWLSGKFGRGRKHRQNEGFVVRAKILDTGFQGKLG